jgi:hypothetical protein
MENSNFRLFGENEKWKGKYPFVRCKRKRQISVLFAANGNERKTSVLFAANGNGKLPFCLLQTDTDSGNLFSLVGKR